jgi:surfeit locus 1 family protein
MKRYAALAIGLAAAALFLRLGVWQVQRHAERRDRNEMLATRLAAPPIDLDTLIADTSVPDSLHFRRAFVHGVFDFERQLIVTARSRGGVPGVHVVTPLLREGSAVLVERGWLFAPDGRTAELDSVREADSALVRGVLTQAPDLPEITSPDTLWPRRARSADPTDLQPAYPYPLFPLKLRRTELEQERAGGLRAVPVPELSGGPHLSYAVQWFAFAVIALVGGVLLTRRY